MLVKYIVPAALGAISSLQGVAAAVSGHRHQHQKKDYVVVATDVVVETDWVTKTVYCEDNCPQQTDAAAVVGQDVTSTAPAVINTPAPETPAPVPAAPVPVPAPANSDIPAVDPAPVPIPAPVPAPAAPAPAPVNSDAPVEGSAPAAAPAPAPVTTTEPAAETTTSVASQPAVPAATSYPTTPPSTANGRGKRGVSYNDPKLVAFALSVCDKIKWAYNWGASSGGIAVRYVPTLWGPTHGEGWARQAQAAIDAGADTLFSFNECDIHGQCNTGPADTAAAHKALMNPWAGKARISAPSISSSQDAGSGLDWLAKFFAACDGACRYDVCNAHWYGPGGRAGADEFLAHVRAVHNVCAVPVWVTEFAGNQGGDEAEFIRIVVDQLDNNATYSFVEGYSYFYLAVGSLLKSPTELSEIGKAYFS